MLKKYELMIDMMIYYKKKIFLNVPKEKLFEIFHKQVLEYYKSLYLPDWCSKLIIYQLKNYMNDYHKIHPHFGKIKINTFTNKIIAIY